MDGFFIMFFYNYTTAAEVNTEMLGGFMYIKHNASIFVYILVLVLV